MSDLAVSRIRTIYAAAILFVSFLLITLPAVPLAHAATCAEKGAGWSCTTDTAGKTCVTGLCPGGADNKCCSSAGGTAAGSSAGEKYGATKPALSIPIPDLQFSDIEVRHRSNETREIDIPWIAEYFTAIYKFAVAVASALAAVMMMIGGFQYLTAGGDATRVSAAKKKITDALIGLALTLGVYVILFTINPDLVNMNALTVQLIERKEFIANETTDFNPAEAASGENGSMGNNGVPVIKQGAYASLPYLNATPPVCTKNGQGKAYTVATSGCGVSSAAMVIAKYKGQTNAEQTLRDLVDLAAKTPGARPCKPDCSDCNGTAFGPFSDAISDKFGIKTKFVNSVSNVKSLLQQGKPVIALMGPSIFTSGGHYIVLTGMSGDNYTINDPFRTNYKKDYSTNPATDLPSQLNMGSVPAQYVDDHFKSFILLEPE